MGADLNAGGAPPPAVEALTGVPLALQPPKAAPRDFWLRLALLLSLLGAALSVFYAWAWTQPAAPAAPALMPVLALVTVAGALVLESWPVLGMLLLLGGSLPGLTVGSLWMAPGAACGCFWAARERRAARATLGLLLLLPGAAAIFFGVIGGLSYATGVPLHGLPGGLITPGSMLQALAPVELLPLAVAGAWLLVASRDGEA
ncbi:MAG: hypothetical protein ACRD01_14775 [Terriglobales bacterium]